jgi:hypothetical protein
MASQPAASSRATLITNLQQQQQQQELEDVSCSNYAALAGTVKMNE